MVRNVEFHHIQYKCYVQVNKNQSDNEKKRDLTVSVDIRLNEKLEKYLTENDYSNKSKYIEKLIKDDLSDKNNK